METSSFTPLPSSLAERRCIICFDPFTPLVPTQRVCRKFECREKRDVQRAAQNRFWRTALLTGSASLPTLQKTWKAQDGRCCSCKAEFKVSPKTGVPRASWVNLGGTTGIFVCLKCGWRLRRLQCIFSRKPLSVEDSLRRLDGLLDSIDEIQNDVRGSGRANSEARRRARFLAGLEAAPIDADVDGARLREIDS